MPKMPRSRPQRPAGKDGRPGHDAHTSCDPYSFEAETHYPPAIPIPLPMIGIFYVRALASPANGRVESAPSRARKAKPMNNRWILDDPPSDGIDWPELYRRLSVLEQNQRDTLFLLRSLRSALHNSRVELSPGLVPPAGHAVPPLSGGRGGLCQRLRSPHACPDVSWQRRQTP